MKELFKCRTSPHAPSLWYEMKNVKGVVRTMGRRRNRWSNDDYDQSSCGSYSRNRCDSGERQIKYRDRSRDRYNGYYLNKYRERSGR